jgi:CRP-like cAMP-binding protein
MSDSSFVGINQLLYTLIKVTNQRLLPYLEEVSLTSGQIIQESGSKITDVYFPKTTRVTSLLVMSDKSTIEIISIGNEGLANLSIVLGSDIANNRLIAQIAGTAIKLSADVIKQEFNRGEDLQQILLLYTQEQLNQIYQIAACRSHHNLEQRLARWLLLICDHVDQDTLPLTQKFISVMLGVRRASITEMAIAFQKQGIIKYSRGQITILDRLKLESIACECYGKIKSEYKRLLESRLFVEN